MVLAVDMLLCTAGIGSTAIAEMTHARFDGIASV